MKKRLAAFLLICCMLPWGFVYAEESVSTFENDIAKLSAFGILENEDYQSEAFVTRGEFAVYLANAMNLSAHDETGFFDVLDENYLTAVSALEQHNIVLGNGGEYKPEDIITNTDAVVMIMRALGYSEVAQLAGGYPMGFVRYAGDVEVIKGIEGKLSDYAQMDTIAKMLCNMLEANIYVVKFNSENSLSYNQGQTFMKKYYDAYKLTGILQGDDEVNINGLAVNGRENAVTFEYRDYFTNFDLSDYLGCKITIYYVSDDGENTIIYAEEHKSNSVTVVSGYDVSGFDKDDFIFEYEKDGKGKKLNFYNGTNFILNGEYVTDVENTVLDSADGEIKAIDNDDDGKIDVFIITQYDYMIADRVSVNEEFIVDKITDKMIPVDLDELKIEKDGKEVTLDSIASGSLLEVTKSAAGEIKEIKVYEAYTGKCSGYSAEEITIDGQVLQFSVNYLKKAQNNQTKKIVIGNTVTYYKNCDGRVVWVDTDVAEAFLYGYLINILNDEVIERDIFKILTADDEIKKIKAAEKVLVNEDRISGNGLNSRTEFSDDGISVKRQLIMYSKNTNGEINKVLTARDTLEDAVAKGADRTFAKNYGDIDAILDNKDKFSLDFYTTSSIRHVKGLFYSTFGIASKTTIFNVPEPTETEVSDEDFYVGTTSQFEDDKTYGNLYFFDFDESLNAAALVRYGNNATESIGNTPFLVDSLRYVIDEDNEIKPKVFGYASGKYVQYKGDDNEYLSKESVWGTALNKDYSGIGWESLKKGDILFYELNKDKEMVAYRVCAHDITNLNTYYMIGGYSSTGVVNGRDSYGERQLCIAEVNDVTQSHFFVRTTTTSGDEMIRKLKRSGYIYVLEDDKLTASSFNDLAEGDKVVVVCGYDIPLTTVIVKG